jgi:hypothetical protein
METKENQVFENAKKECAILEKVGVHPNAVSFIKKFAF